MAGAGGWSKAQWDQTKWCDYCDNKGFRRLNIGMRTMVMHCNCSHGIGEVNAANMEAWTNKFHDESRIAKDKKWQEKNG